MTTGELHANHDVRLSRAMSSLRENAQALSAAWDLDTMLDLIARRIEQVMQVNPCAGTQQRHSAAARLCLLGPRCDRARAFVAG